MRMALALLPICAIAAYFVWAAFKYTRMISNIFLSLVYKPALEPQAASAGEKLVILNSRDEEIEALYLARRGASKLAVFCHESGAGKESWEKYAYFLPDLGFNVLAFDFKQRGGETEQNSLSQWPTEDDVERLVTVIRWAKKAGKPDSPVVLFGVSNGADIAFAASFRDPAVKAVVADGLFSMKECFRDYIRKWAPILVRPNFFGEHYPSWVVNLFTELGFWYSQRRSKRLFVDIEPCLAKKHVPLLMIHGEKDDYVPAGHQSFLERMNRGRTLVPRVVVPKAGHNQAVVLGREMYEKKVRHFLSTLAVAAAFFFAAPLWAAPSPASPAPEKQLLADMAALKNTDAAPLAAELEGSLKAYGSLRDYTAVFHKQELTKELDGLGPSEEIFLKFEKPFKIYLGWLNTHKKGLQVLYERGRHGGKLAIHKPGLLLGLAPVVFLEQSSPWVREGSSSYDIEDAGIGSFLIDFSRAVLRAAREKKLRVRPGPASEKGSEYDVTFVDTKEDTDYFAYRVRVLFDALTRLPVRMELFDWQERPIGVYSYDGLRIDVGSQDAAFKKTIHRGLLSVYKGD